MTDRDPRFLSVRRRYYLILGYAACLGMGLLIDIFVHGFGSKDSYVLTHFAWWQVLLSLASLFFIGRHYARQLDEYEALIKETKAKASRQQSSTAPGSGILCTGKPRTFM